MSDAHDKNSGAHLSQESIIADEIIEKMKAIDLEEIPTRYETIQRLRESEEYRKTVEAYKAAKDPGDFSFYLENRFKVWNNAVEITQKSVFNLLCEEFENKGYFVSFGSAVTDGPKKQRHGPCFSIRVTDKDATDPHSHPHTYWDQGKY